MQGLEITTLTGFLIIVIIMVTNRKRNELELGIRAQVLHYNIAASTILLSLRNGVPSAELFLTKGMAEPIVSSSHLFKDHEKFSSVMETM
jgi:hypothetical protein